MKCLLPLQKKTRGMSFHHAKVGQNIFIYKSLCIFKQTSNILIRSRCGFLWEISQYLFNWLRAKFRVFILWYAQGRIFRITRKLAFAINRSKFLNLHLTLSLELERTLQRKFSLWKCLKVSENIWLPSVSYSARYVCLFRNESIRNNDY